MPVLFYSAGGFCGFLRGFLRTSTVIIRISSASLQADGSSRGSEIHCNRPLPLQRGRHSVIFRWASQGLGTDHVNFVRVFLCANARYALTNLLKKGSGNTRMPRVSRRFDERALRHESQRTAGGFAAPDDALRVRHRTVSAAARRIRPAFMTGAHGWPKGRNLS